ncbi:MAG: phosphonoacetaldehyde hydrolase [Deltaproteobacteria bacterium]|nr:phosphonoacetaldehyde hydrolase [Candidatus Anaeroferrophillacea bacterium]
MGTIRETATSTQKVRGVVLDWAGTTVDYGSRGPAAVFVDVFRRFGVTASITAARRFMGMAKKDHVRNMLALPEIAGQWREVHGRLPGDRDLDEVYAATEPMMIETVARHAEPIPGVLDTVAELRRRGIAIGSSTGYTAPIMAALLPAAKRHGYEPDVVVCATDVPAGRPYPWMCWLNAIRLEIFPLAAMVKIGDTISDIEAGINAGMWTVGVTLTGNETGLPQAEAKALPAAEREARHREITTRFGAAGAHYCVAALADVPPLIDEIDARLKQGEKP